MNKSIPFLLIITLLVPGCFSEPTNQSITRFDSFEEQRLYRLIIDPDIDTIFVDIDYVGDRKPPQIAIEAIRENLEIIAPNRNIAIPEPTPINVGDDSSDYLWNLKDMWELSQSERDGNDRDKNAVIHVMVLNGKDEAGPPTKLGFFLVDLIVIFPDNLAIPINNQPEVIRGILVHELGHAVGLINFGAPMMTPRLPSEEDDPCQCHSTQEDSPLYYNFATNYWLLERVQDGKYIPYRLNKDDLADIEEFKRQHQN